ncbi:GNAT family N-acetyltransferase [Solitalea lacus]|uniref:GNAT family N-acetyltransferase n=1 Tax=Solitalea lacus TaxID=2911172 RepID=UPI001EDBF303|nr:GNAT family N-acetyltransferase [Solitalea lacus]UKJ07640.1 N-acetyltransferase family protein [Solitalea lacus]
MTIIPMQPEHWEAVKAIYEEGIATDNATFQLSAPDWAEWDQSHLKHCRLVIIEDNIVMGWAALTQVSDRCVYAGVAEVSVYVAEKYRGNGIGALLLNELVAESEKNGIWTLQAGIFPENKGSLALHQKFDFRLVGKRERIGKMNGKWRDTLLLERRSTKVGIE